MSKKKKNEDPYIDDGRVIADMSIDGMPQSLSGRLFSGGKRKRLAKLDEAGRPIEMPDNTVELTKAEKRAITWGVLKAYAVYALITIGFLVGMFCLLYFFWL